MLTVEDIDEILDHIRDKVLESLEQAGAFEGHPAKHTIRHEIADDADFTAEYWINEKNK